MSAVAQVRRRLRFSLRTVFLGLTAVCFVLATVGRWGLLVQRQRQAASFLQSHQVEVIYDFQCKNEHRCAQWLYYRMGLSADMLGKVVGIDCRGQDEMD